MITKAKYLAFFLLFAASCLAQTVFPFQGLGSAQFFDNNGQPLTAGVLYSFQAGTSTQQATYTDSSGLILNPNPIPFGSGARVGIWLSSGAFYKFVLCLQNDGPSCAPADVLFSVDQVPGNPSGLNNGTTFIGTFITGSSTPATTGILRLATSDQICWRNQANTANLCISKDTGDVLTWAGDAMKFPEGSCTLAGLNFDFLCASSSNHRWLMANNGGGQLQIAAAGVDINTSDQVTQLHFGATPTPLSATPPSTNQFLQWSGTQVVGAAIPTQPSVISYVRKNMVGNVSVPLSTTTTLTTQLVTMPSSGCPCRILVNWSITANNNPSNGDFSGQISDGTNIWAITMNAESATTQWGMSTSGWSPVTYANGATPTLQLQTRSNGSSYTALATGGAFSAPTGMDITVFYSN